MNQLMTYFDIISRTAATSRFSQTHLVKDESVLEHTGFVCMISYFIALRLQLEGFGIDFGKMLSKAVAHDIDEIVTGDIPRPTKYYNAGIREALEEIEIENMKAIDSTMNMAGDLYRDWASAKKNKEGFIVALADNLAIVYKANQECLMFGNKTIVEHTTGTINNLLDRQNEAEIHFNRSACLPSIISDAIMICKQIGAHKNENSFNQQ